MTVPVVTTALAFVLLMALGTWQIERLIWKRDLMALIESRMSVEPAPLPAGDIEAADWEYRRVSVRGRLLHEHEIHVLARRPGFGLGYHVFTPLERAGGATVMINRGWTPSENKDAATRAAGQLPGVVEISGIARQPWLRSRFAPDDDALANVWFGPDIAAMARHLGRPLAPLFIEAGDRGNPGGLPVGGQTRVDIRNDHLQYAITWYLLAIAVVVIFLVYRRQQRKG